jgi:aspartyl-tRNA(Asn)/glutamyl-tRNA(Gln) amidotransferase subunit A
LPVTYADFASSGRRPVLKYWEQIDSICLGVDESEESWLRVEEWTSINLNCFFPNVDNYGLLMNSVLSTMSLPSPRLTIRQVSRLIDLGLVTSEQLAAFCHSLASAGEEIWRLNAFATIVALDDVLREARAADQRRHLGERLSLLDGIPISVKANIAVASEPLTAGSRILGCGRPGTPACGFDSDTMRILLRDCGAVLVGTTSMDEFGMGSLGTNVVSRSRDAESTNTFTRNPLKYLERLQLLPPTGVSATTLDDDAVAQMIQMPTDKIHEAHALAFEEDAEIFSAGGSSCGSAASVAHGSSLLSLGTDTGGSVRLPAAWCGVVGLKPSYGLLSRHGVVSYASSFDTVGILAPSIDCAAIALEKVAQRRGGKTRLSLDSTASFYTESMGPLDTEHGSLDLSDIKVGIPAALSVRECPPYIQHAWSRAAQFLAKHGASIEIVSADDISPNLVQQALAAYYVLVSAEASSNLSRYDGFRYGVSADDPAENMEETDLTQLERQFNAARVAGFGVDVARRILCGSSVLSSDRFHTHYELAAKVRACLAKEFYATLAEKVDVLLFPTSLSLPWSLGEGKDMDMTQMFANDVMTVSASLAGLPSVSVPVPGEHGSIFQPGLQVVGSRLREDLILRVGRVLGSDRGSSEPKSQIGGPIKMI